MKEIKRVLHVGLVALFAAILVCVTTGCVRTSVEEAKPTLTPTTQVGGLVTPGTLTVGLKQSDPPFSMQSGTDTVGINADLAAAIAENLGLKVVFVPVGDGASELTNGTVDIIMGISTDEDGLTNGVTVVGRYLDNAPGLFTKTSTGEPVTATQQEVSKSMMGVQEKSVSWALVTKLFPTGETSTYPTLNDAFAALASGEVAYVACDSYAGGYLSTEHDGVAFAGTLGIPTSSGIAVSADNAELQSAIQTSLDSLMANGIYDLVRSRWVGTLPRLSTDTMVLLDESGKAIVGTGGSTVTAPADTATPSADSTATSEETTTGEEDATTSARSTNE